MLNFILIGSAQPIEVVPGDDVILPCHVEPVQDVVAMTIEWSRPDLDPMFVYLWRARQDNTYMKNPMYTGRTSLSVDELKKGNMSLKLTNVQLSDRGTYTCLFLANNLEMSVELIVATSSKPVVKLVGIGKPSGSVVLECMSSGWYPEPEVSWMDSEGHLVSTGPPETVRGPDDLYTVSSRVTTLDLVLFDTDNMLTLCLWFPGQPHSFGTPQPIVIALGDDVVLPCHLEPAQDAEGFTLKWTRPDLKPRFVHVWRAGVELQDKQHPQYQGRTALFTDELKHGNISLKLVKVKPADEGTYRCYIPLKDCKTLHFALLDLKKVLEFQNEKRRNGMVLECTSSGWYPEPEVSWMDSEGHLVSAGPPETVRGFSCWFGCGHCSTDFTHCFCGENKFKQKQ
uniref:Ig-like domain-containing protein n=1 Tax=Sphaeramia orbicularis TaxID=375764 RepID=A0A672ZAZ2_9TELE